MESSDKELAIRTELQARALTPLFPETMESLLLMASVPPLYAAGVEDGKTIFAREILAAHFDDEQKPQVPDSLAEQLRQLAVLADRAGLRIAASHVKRLAAGELYDAPESVQKIILTEPHAAAPSLPRR